MARLSWTEDAVSVGGVCERGFAVERKGTSSLACYGTPLNSLGSGHWCYWAMGEGHTSATTAW